MKFYEDDDGTWSIRFGSDDEKKRAREFSKSGTPVYFHKKGEECPTDIIDDGEPAGIGTE